MTRRSRVICGLLLAVGVAIVVPIHIFATRNICRAEGYSVIYINGIFTTREQANNDKDNLFSVFNKKYRNQLSKDDFRVGYNASHLNGLGDLIKSVEQKMNETEGASKEDFDLITIAKQLSAEVGTEKILIVGHSQGTFYANALYDYLIRRGVPAKSIAVYNIATPASYVAGHGKYLTNSNDRVINEVRHDADVFNFPQPLPANMTIPEMPGDEHDEWAGHSISDVYLKERPTDIASTIAKMLSNLEAEPGRDSSQPCIPPPEGTVSYLAKRIAFSVSDPLAHASAPVIAVANTVGNSVADPFLAVGRGIAGALHKALARGGNTQTAAAHEALNPIAADAMKPPAFLAEASNVPVPKPALSIPTSEPSNKPLVQVDPAPAPVAPPEPPPTPAPIIVPIGAPPSPPAVGPGGLPSFTPGDGRWGAGGGGSGATAESAPTPTPTPELKPTPIAALSVTEPADNLLASSTALTASGTADANAVVTLSFDGTATTTTANRSGAWSFTLTLSEGAHTFAFAAANTAGAASATTTRVVTIDLTPPAAPASMRVAQCNYSLVIGSCVLPERTVTAMWDAADGASSYKVFVGDSETTAASSTSASITLADNATSSIAVRAYDAVGNQSADSSAVKVAIVSQPVIINEVAWAGTTANSEHEWLELKNISNYAIDMSKLAVVATDGAPYIALSGTLPAVGGNNFYLIERNTLATSMPDSLHTLFDQMNDSGEELHLVHGNGTATTSIDQTPAVAVCGGWCYGSLPITINVPAYADSVAALSMERVSGATVGSLKTSWQNNDAYTTYGSDAAGNLVYGTPGSENSAGLPSAGWYCGIDSPIASGARYVPPSPGGITIGCTYLSAFINAQATRWGMVFKGTQGNNAVSVFGHALGRGQKSQQNFTGGIPGNQNDSFFIAIFAQRGDNDIADFMNWFQYGTTTSGSTNPPHQDYRVIPWIYGP